MSGFSRVFIGSLALVCAAAVAQPSGAPAGPVNAECPVGHEAIVAEAGTVEVDGHLVGFCCSGCVARFESWDADAKREFISSALQSAHANQSVIAQAEVPSEPYTLGVCAVAGTELGPNAVTEEIDGREVKFCCTNCAGKFKADPGKYLEALNERIIEDQMPYYPIDTCLVADDALFEDGEDIAINCVYKNRLIRFCCKGCVGEFEADPAMYLEKLNKAAADRQRELYPITTCLVAGGPLGSMGEPIEFVTAGRLARLCCNGCTKKYKADPAKYISMVDKAWTAAREQDASIVPGVGR
ncbi:MAG: hypothetical protein H6811_04595 [Phycisphaeraceae bacterium]|nr:hypothetical protein [Phycisphaeraceae bacterium]